MIRIGICDDDRELRQEICGLCEQFFGDKEACRVQEYASGEAFMKALAKGAGTDETYGKNVFGFLKKPLDRGKFVKKMQEVLEDLEQEKRCAEIRGNNTVVSVPVSRILYVRASGIYTHVWFEKEMEGRFDERSIGEREKTLRYQGFCMSHRGYLVNLAHVKRIGEGEALLDEDGRAVPVSRRKRTEFKEAYKKYMVKYAR